MSDKTGIKIEKQISISLEGEMLPVLSRQDLLPSKKILCISLGDTSEEAVDKYFDPWVVFTITELDTNEIRVLDADLDENSLWTFNINTLIAYNNDCPVFIPWDRLDAEHKTMLTLRYGIKAAQDKYS